MTALEPEPVVVPDALDPWVTDEEERLAAGTEQRPDAGTDGHAGADPVTGPTPPADQSTVEAVGRNWVAAMLVGTALLAAFGLVVALVAGGGLGALVALVATVAAAVAALVESHSRPLIPGRSGARLWYYSRIVVVVVVAIAAAQFDANGAGAGSIGWHIPTSMVALALVALWWRDPQRPV